MILFDSLAGATVKQGIPNTQCLSPLGSHADNSTRWGTNENYSGIRQVFRKDSILAEEAIPWMDGLRRNASIRRKRGAVKYTPALHCDGKYLRSCPSEAMCSDLTRRTLSMTKWILA